MTTRKKNPNQPEAHPAEVVREYGPFPGTDEVAGVTFDGSQVWFARGDSIVALDPNGGTLGRQIAVPAHAGTAFDGKHLWQIADDRIQKVDAHTGEVLSTIPAPAQGRDSGLTWAEGTLWVGEYRASRIHEIDPETGAILRTIESDHFVTGVTWTNGELWHAAVNEEQAQLRRIDPATGDVLDRLDMPPGCSVSGLEADGSGLFYCGGGSKGTVRSVRKPKR